MFSSRAELRRRCHSVWGVQEENLDVPACLADIVLCQYLFAWRRLVSKRIAQSVPDCIEALRALSTEVLMRIVCLSQQAPSQSPVRERAVGGRPVYLVPEGRKSVGSGWSRRHTLLVWPCRGTRATRREPTRAGRRWIRWKHTSAPEMNGGWWEDAGRDWAELVQYPR